MSISSPVSPVDAAGQHERRLTFELPAKYHAKYHAKNQRLGVDVQ